MLFAFGPRVGEGEAYGRSGPSSLMIDWAVPPGEKSKEEGEDAEGGEAEVFPGLMDAGGLNVGVELCSRSQMYTLPSSEPLMINDSSGPAKEHRMRFLDVF